jgi:P-type E1-E2 ATPase
LTTAPAAAIAIMLSVGVSRIAKRRAIIRKLPAVETSVITTVIYPDKTGTLTRSEMTVQKIHALHGRFLVCNDSFIRYLKEGRP